MRAAFRKIADVADVVAFAIPVDVFENLLLAAYRGGHLEGFQNADAVFPAAAQIIDLAHPWRLPEFLDKPRDVVAVDVVADLLALVAEDPVEAPLDVATHQVAKKAMQLDPAVVGTRQAAATQAAGLHAEVAPIFLHHDVTGELRGPKEAVFALVDAECFSDAVEVGRVGEVPACIELFECQFIGLVAVDLVRAHVREYSVGHCAAGCFQHVQRADCIDVKIVKRATGGQVVAGLGGGMHDHVRPDLFQTAQHRRPVPYIEFVMGKSLMSFAQPLLVPARIALHTEKVRAHIVVDAVNPPAQTAEMRDYFRADQPGAAGDKKLLHFVGVSILLRWLQPAAC